MVGRFIAAVRSGELPFVVNWKTYRDFLEFTSDMIDPDFVFISVMMRSTNGHIWMQA